MYYCGGGLISKLDFKVKGALKDKSGSQSQNEHHSDSRNENVCLDLCALLLLVLLVLEVLHVVCLQCFK